MFRRLVYASRSTGANSRRDLEAILAVSRRNNGIDGVSGLLWAEEDRYLQLLEGPPDSVSETFARIRRDPRHDGIAVVLDGQETERVFGDWSMASLPGERPQDAAARLRMLLTDAPDDVTRLFRQER